MRGERFAKEGLRSGNAAIRPQHEFYGAPLLVDGSVQVMRLGLDRNIGLVNPPGAANRASKSVPTLVEFRNIPNHPPHDRRVSKDYAAFAHHRNKIPVAQAIRDVPPHAQSNSLGVEVALHIDRITVLTFGHRAAP